MRCRSCNVILEDYELDVKFTHSHEEVELCSGCLADTPIFEDYETEEMNNENREYF